MTCGGPPRKSWSSNCITIGHDAVMVEVDDVAGALEIVREAKEEQRGAG